jgi:hypothetical protein
MSEFAITPRQIETLRAAADRIIPPDETSGAADAGAVDFIQGLLRAELSGEQSTYLQGLDGIEREALAAHGKSYALLSPAEQDAVLTTIDGNLVKTSWTISPPAFFRMLVENVLEGFYADPANGGNRDAVSWKMIGYRAEGGTW